VQTLEDRTLLSAPTAYDQSETTLHDQPLFGDVYAENFDGDPLTFFLYTSPVNGDLDFSSEGTFTFTASPSFAGSVNFSWWASDGVDDSNLATVTINVTNQAPVVTAIANQDSIEGRNVSLQATANDPDGDNLQFSATGLPDRLQIDQNTGLISGKLSYTSAGSHVVIVTVTDTLPAATAVGFTWTVADTTIGLLTGKEYNGATYVRNSVTVSGTWHETLYLSPGNTMQREVSSFQRENLPLWSDILFEVERGTDVNPSSGDFNNVNWPNISVTGTGLRTVSVGTDLNGDGTLDPATEVTHSFWVKLIDLSKTTIKSQRVGGGPVEPGLTPIKATEHFEVGGQFKFAVVDVTGSLLGENALIGYVLYHSSNPLATGSGRSFTYSFGAGAAEGDDYVWVYNDKNNNGTFDNGEQFKQSPLFHVMQKRVFNIVADVSNKIPNSGFAAGLGNRGGTNPGLFQRAENLLLTCLTCSSGGKKRCQERMALPPIRQGFSTNVGHSVPFVSGTFFRSGTFSLSRSGLDRGGRQDDAGSFHPGTFQRRPPDSFDHGCRRSRGFFRRLWWAAAEFGRIETAVEKYRITPSWSFCSLSARPSSKLSQNSAG
jgi:Putative Ig domain/Bacterial Ig domain